MQEKVQPDQTPNDNDDALTDEVQASEIHHVQLPADDDAQLGERFVAKFMNCSVSKLQNDRYLKRGIPFGKFGSLVGYRAGDVRNAIRENRVETSGS